MLNKILLSLGIASAIFISNLQPVLASNFSNAVLGGAAVFTAIQLNHNHHQAGINKNLYNSGRMGTFSYNGKTVNCHHEHGNTACYQRDGNHWTYIPNH